MVLYSWNAFIVADENYYIWYNNVSLDLTKVISRNLQRLFKEKGKEEGFIMEKQFDEQKT